jgi:hypothetical protein
MQHLQSFIGLLLLDRVKLGKEDITGRTKNAFFLSTPDDVTVQLFSMATSTLPQHSLSCHTGRDCGVC